MVEMEWWVVIITPTVYSLQSQVRKRYHCDCGDMRGLLWRVLITRVVTLKTQIWKKSCEVTSVVIVDFAGRVQCTLVRVLGGAAGDWANLRFLTSPGGNLLSIRIHSF